MNLFFRLILVSIFSRYRSRVSVLGPCETTFRCWLTDLDIQRHMNNGRYFSILDIARTDLIIRTGIAKKISQNGWYPVVAAETIRFKKSLYLFDKFKVETTVIGWDEKAFLIRQVVVRNETRIAEAVIRVRFLTKTGGFVEPKEILEIAGIGSLSPNLELWIQQWNQNQI